MTDFIIKKLPYDLNSTAGLALVGQYLKRINLNVLVDPAFPVRVPSHSRSSSEIAAEPSHCASNSSRL
jgi:hypothetical protein